MARYDGYFPNRSNDGDSMTETPYGQIPERATPVEVNHYHANFAKALDMAAQRAAVRPETKYLRDRIATYLRSSFDPRPFTEIEDDFRTIVAGELSRV